LIATPTTRVCTHNVAHGDTESCSSLHYTVMQ